MRQVLQNLEDDSDAVAAVPCPRLPAGQSLIRTRTTLVSADSEPILVDFGKANFIDMARQQPSKVRMVLDKNHIDGLGPTLDAVRNKLDQLLAMYAATRGRFTVALRFADGSTGTIVYFRQWQQGYPKARVEVFAAGRVLQLDNFRRLMGFGWPGFNRLNLWRQDNG